MKYEIERLKNHLSRQIQTAEKLNSDWVYITLNEAKLCLKLAESEEDILNAIEELQKGEFNNGQT